MRQYKKQSELTQGVAYVEWDGKYFQSLNADGDDWDESETMRQIEKYKNGRLWDSIKRFFGVKE